MTPYKILAPNQILTTRKGIVTQLIFQSYLVFRTVLRCVSQPPDAPDYLLRLYAAASCLERLSAPVYRTKQGEIKKLSAAIYRRRIFDPYAETPEELFDHAKDYGAAEEDAARFHKILYRIADTVCPMVAKTDGRYFLYEYAAAIDSAIRDLPTKDGRTKEIKNLIRQYEGL